MKQNSCIRLYFRLSQASSILADNKQAWARRSGPERWSRVNLGQYPELKLERAQARESRPGPNFGPIVNKPQAQKRPGLLFFKVQQSPGSNFTINLHFDVIIYGTNRPKILDNLTEAQARLDLEKYKPDQDRGPKY